MLLPCSKEAVANLFLKFTSILKLVFLFSYFFSVFVAKLFTFLCRDDDDYEDETSCEDEEEEEEEEVDTMLVDQDEEGQEEEIVAEDGYSYCNYGKETETEHLVADIIGGGEELVFLSRDQHYQQQQQNDDQSALADHHHHNIHHHRHAHNISYGSIFEEPVESFDTEDHGTTATTAATITPAASSIDSPADLELSTNYENSKEITVEEEEEEDDLDEGQDFDSEDDSFEIVDENVSPSPVVTAIGLNKHWILPADDEDHHGKKYEKEKIYEEVKAGVEAEGRTEFSTDVDGNYVFYSPSKLVGRKLNMLEKDQISCNEQEEEVYGDTYTIGSTSNSSSEWRSSINCRDSTTTEDPFSSSSRRSCPKWESYTVYQKYDEEMTFLDRISAQKLQETESLKSFQVEPRSISQRIVYRFATNNKRTAEYKSSYNELEAAYVAQICLAWEALNWNYNNFQRKRALIKGSDLGCPAKIAQQFQQFQVLLQRYIENEPYEYGRRPEIYARMRGVTPKLLQVPEYHDYEDEEKEGVLSSRISSASFIVILEESIRTFMNFLKGDKESHCRILAALVLSKRRRNQNGSGSIDPALLHMMRKTNNKKKLKLKDLQRAGKCFRKKKLRIEEEIEILMGLIDLKVVSRVLRMGEITQQQFKWCEEKMAKVTLSQGQLHRDSSPLFYPAH